MPTLQDMKAQPRAPPNLPPLAGLETSRSVKPLSYLSPGRSRMSFGGESSVRNATKLLNSTNQNGAANEVNSKRYSIPTNSTIRKAVNFTQPRWKSKLLDVNMSYTPQPLRKARTTADVAKVTDSNDYVLQKTTIASKFAESPALLRRQQLPAPGFARAANETLKAFSSPSVLAASKSSLYKMPLRPTYPNVHENQRDCLLENTRKAKVLPTGNEQQEEEPFMEDFTEKRGHILQWLAQVDENARPPTPPSRFDDFVEKSLSPSEAPTAIQIVYPDDAETQE